MSGRYGFRSGLQKNNYKIACERGGWGLNEMALYQM